MRKLILERVEMDYRKREVDEKGNESCLLILHSIVVPSCHITFSHALLVLRGRVFKEQTKPR